MLSFKNALNELAINHAVRLSFLWPVHRAVTLSPMLLLHMYFTLLAAWQAHDKVRDIRHF